MKNYHISLKELRPATPTPEQRGWVREPANGHCRHDWPADECGVCKQVERARAL